MPLFVSYPKIKAARSRQIAKGCLELTFLLCLVGEKGNKKALFQVLIKIIIPEYALCVNPIHACK
jgi:hypothetical protein